MLARTTIIGIALSVVMVGAAAHAQEAPEFQKGNRTLALSGSGSSDRDFDTSMASIQLGMGRFVTDNVAASVRQGIGFADVGGRDAWNGSTRLGLDYFLNMGRFKPFVGANLGYLYGDTVKEQFIAGPDVGARIFVNDTTFINLVVEYQFLFEDADEADNAYDDGRFVYALGMGVKW